MNYYTQFTIKSNKLYTELKDSCWGPHQKERERERERDGELICEMLFASKWRRGQDQYDGGDPKGGDSTRDKSDPLGWAVSFR